MTESNAPSDSSAIEVTRHEETLLVGTEVRPYRRVRIAKRIVTETKTITVDVQREELVFEEWPAGDEHAATPPVPFEPIDVVLHREELTVTRHVVPVERVRVAVEVVEGDAHVATSLRSEVVEVDVLTG